MNSPRDISRRLTHVLFSVQRMIDTASVDAEGQIADVQERMRLDDLFNDAQAALDEIRTAAFEPRPRAYAGTSVGTPLRALPPLAG